MNKIKNILRQCHCQAGIRQKWKRRITQLVVENLLTVSKSVALIGEVKDLTSMSKPAEQRGSKDSIAKDLSSAVKALVRGKDI